MMNQTIAELKAAPDFVLKDSEGREVALSDFKGSRQVVLVFNRGFV